MPIAPKKAHAEFSASASYRWLACPGSARLNKKVPNIESRWAKEGTTAHECLEFLVNHRRDRVSAKKFLKTKYPLTMIAHAEAALDYVETRLATLPGSNLHVELKTFLPVDEPNQYGTSDIVIEEPYGRLVVGDYKYGAGVCVEPNSSQLIYYALGVAHQFNYNFQSVELIIIQPRFNHRNGPVRSHLMSIEDLEEWREIFNEGIKRCKEPRAPLKSGKHCQFCNAKAICPEYKNLALRQAQEDLADLDDGDDI